MQLYNNSPPPNGTGGWLVSILASIILMFCVYTWLIVRGLFKGNEVIHNYGLITDVTDHLVEGIHVSSYIATLSISQLTNHVLNCSYNYVCWWNSFVHIGWCRCMFTGQSDLHKTLTYTIDIPHYWNSLPIHHQGIKFMLEHQICSWIQSMHFCYMWSIANPL